MPVRPARKTDASDMVALIDIAGYGAPSWVWQGMRQGEPSVLEVGRKRAMREEGGFSYRNAQMFEVESTIAGMIIGYALDDPYDTGDLTKINEVFRPLIELESQAPGSWYVNVLAVFDEHRGKGYGRQLLQAGEETARQAGATQLSIIVESSNTAARRLYENAGYSELARRPFIPFPGSHTGSDEWVLLTKDIEL